MHNKLKSILIVFLLFVLSNQENTVYYKYSAPNFMQTSQFQMLESKARINTNYQEKKIYLDIINIKDDLLASVYIKEPENNTIILSLLKQGAGQDYYLEITESTGIFDDLKLCYQNDFLYLIYILDEDSSGFFLPYVKSFQVVTDPSFDIGYELNLQFTQQLTSSGSSSEKSYVNCLNLSNNQVLFASYTNFVDGQEGEISFGFQTPGDNTIAKIFTNIDQNEYPCKPNKPVLNEDINNNFAIEYVCNKIVNDNYQLTRLAISQIDSQNGSLSQPVFLYEEEIYDSYNKIVVKYSDYNQYDYSINTHYNMDYYYGNQHEQRSILIFQNQMSFEANQEDENKISFEVYGLHQSNQNSQTRVRWNRYTDDKYTDQFLPFVMAKQDQNNLYFLMLYIDYFTEIIKCQEIQLPIEEAEVQIFDQYYEDEDEDEDEDGDGFQDENDNKSDNKYKDILIITAYIAGVIIFINVIICCNICIYKKCIQRSISPAKVQNQHYQPQVQNQDLNSLRYPQSDQERLNTNANHENLRSIMSLCGQESQNIGLKNGKQPSISNN